MTETSALAFESIKPHIPNMKERIREMLSYNAMTCDELEESTGWAHQTVSARLSELVKENAIRWNGRFGFTRSNRKARLYENISSS
jgi:predicted HTH transcriptional regulator